MGAFESGSNSSANRRMFASFPASVDFLIRQPIGATTFFDAQEALRPKRPFLPVGDLYIRLIVCRLKGRSRLRDQTRSCPNLEARDGNSAPNHHFQQAAFAAAAR